MVFAEARRIGIGRRRRRRFEIATMTETRFRLLRAKGYRPLRALSLLVASVILIFSGHLSHTYSQVKENSATAARPQAPVDPNKYAVIINGASGEPAYGKQFEQWTA